jgi:hypothetical protein
MNEILLRAGKNAESVQVRHTSQKRLGAGKKIMWNPKNNNSTSKTLQVLVTKKRTAWKVEVEGIL